MSQPKFSDAKLTMLAWLPVPPAGPRPPESCCLFSDGVKFWCGWWYEDRILVNVSGGSVSVPISPATRPHLHWAKLNTLVEIFEGVKV